MVKKMLEGVDLEKKQENDPGIYLQTESEVPNYPSHIEGLDGFGSMHMKPKQQKVDLHKFKQDFQHRDTNVKQKEFLDLITNTKDQL